MNDNPYENALATTWDFCELNRILDRIFARDIGYVNPLDASAAIERLHLLRDNAERRLWQAQPATAMSVQ